MNQWVWRDVGILALAAIPLLLVVYVSTGSISDVRHTPVEVARVFRIFLLLGIVSCLFAVILSIRRWLAARTNILAIVSAVVALAFLLWALPLAWGVIGAMWLHGDV